MKTPRATLLPLAAAAALLAGCATPLHYVDMDGKNYTGTLDAARNTMTLDVGSKVYEGRYTINQWGQGQAQLKSGSSDDTLSCNFSFVGLKVRGGVCASYSGRSYKFESR